MAHQMGISSDVGYLTNNYLTNMCPAMLIQHSWHALSYTGKEIREGKQKTNELREISNFLLWKEKMVYKLKGETYRCWCCGRDCGSAGMMMATWSIRVYVKSVLCVSYFCVIANFMLWYKQCQFMLCSILLHDLSMKNQIPLVSLCLLICSHLYNSIQARANWLIVCIHVGVLKSNHSGI